MKSLQALYSTHRSHALAGLVFATGLLAVLAANPTHWLQSGFESAINASSKNQHLAHTRRTLKSPIAGSEDYWLGTPNLATRSDLIRPATWRSPVVKGDRFKISSGSTEREYEVIRVEPFVSKLSSDTSGTTANAMTPILVTCQATDGGKTDLIKFVVDKNTELPWMTPYTGAARAL